VGFLFEGWLGKKEALIERNYEFLPVLMKKVLG